MRWVLQHKTLIGAILGIILLIVAGIWFWGVLVGYVNPGTKGATDRKDVVQAFALIAAGVVGLIGGLVGIANLQTSRRNLQQQRNLEEQRTQEDALQAYFQQMGGLLTDQDLINTDREALRQLARAQSHTVLARLDAPRKGSLVRFLHVAGLISKDKSIVGLSRADLREADLGFADLREADLNGAILARAALRFADLRGSVLSGADLVYANLYGAKLSGADLIGADLRFADLRGADLSRANLAAAGLEKAALSDAYLGRACLRGAGGVTAEQLEEQAFSLEGATMPNGQKYEEWLKDKEGRGEDGENSGPS